MPEVTQRDIAKKLGMSMSHVSRALRGHPDVAPEVQEKVQRVAREMGYRPNLLARSLRLQSTRTIGVIITDISNPFYGKTVKGIQDYCWDNDYTIVLCDSSDDYTREEEAIEILLGKRVDGLIIAPTQKQRTDIADLDQSGVPFVLLGRHFTGLRTKCVLFDDVAGGLLATRHLLTRGRRRILFLSAPPYISNAQLRHRGYKQALAAYHVGADPALFRVTEPELEQAYDLMLDLLAEKLEFDAVFAFDDIVAAGAMKALLERGRSIPEDVALVGHDDIELASILHVPLTTVRLPRYEMGVQAAKMVMTASEESLPESKQQVMLAPELVVRSST